MASNQILDVLKGNQNVSPAPPAVVQDCRSEVKANEQIVVYFIGGAGDKESYYLSGPFNNVLDAKNFFDPKLRDLERCKKYNSVYLGYNEVCGDDNIKNKVLTEIPSKLAHVYIVGHSLGGWNGAHLSSILSSLGFSVDMLVTLDPVGEGALVWVGSNIHREKPLPKSKFWINVLANPTKPNKSDSVAEFGERWNVGPKPDVNYIADANHSDARGMFKVAPKDKKSAVDYLYESIRKAAGR